MGVYYVYILTNQNNTTLYIGVTNNIERRLFEHINSTNQGFTKKYKLNKLVYLETTSSVLDAIKREKQLKSMTRKKKEELILQINPNWKDLGAQITEKG